MLFSMKCGSTPRFVSSFTLFICFRNGFVDAEAHEATEGRRNTKPVHVAEVVLGCTGRGRVIFAFRVSISASCRIIAGIY
jgi:hypothetical protein